VRPLVSVVTGTWQRHELLLETIANVRQQTYPNLEHVIVSDGPDPRLATWASQDVGSRYWPACGDPSTVPIRFVELGRNWTTYLDNSRNAAPMIVGQLMARGDYQMWLADDERMTPDHIEGLVDHLESRNADFAYSMTRMWMKDDPSRSWIIGEDPPRWGQITNVLYKASLIERGQMPLGAGASPDWHQIEAWMRSGARWAFRPEVSFEHRADQ